MGYNQVDRIYAGAVVTIYEIQEQGITSWGRIDNGWICMDYISFENPSEALYASSGAGVSQDVINQFIGNWRDITSQRCMMEVPYQNGRFYFTITWGNSAFSTEQWTFSGTYDASSTSIMYSDGSHVTMETMENGTRSTVCHYSNGSGSVIYADGFLWWDDYVEWAGINCQFEKF